MRFRLIKPDWGKDGSIPGKNTIEGDDFSLEFLAEKNAEGYNVYYFPNHNSKPIDHPFLQGADVDVFTKVFVDMDLKDGVYSSTDEFLQVIANFELTPNYVVLSGNGVHAYWEVEDLTREDYLQIQRKLIKTLKTDKAVSSILQLMRFPGFYNTKKKDEFKLAEKIDLTDRRYKTNDFHRILPELSDEEVRKVKEHMDRTDGKYTVDLEGVGMDLPEKFIKLCEKNSKVAALFAAEDEGRRSEDAYKLAQILFDKGFTRPEIISVIANTEKAMEKGQHAINYAQLTVDKAIQAMPIYSVESAAQKALKMRNNPGKQGILVRGPAYFDVLEKRWERGQILGLIAGSGVGKTTITLDIFYNMIKNNQDNDDVFVFFSLEMPDHMIIKRWESLTGGDPSLSERLFVVSNEDENGDWRGINLQQVYWYMRDIRKITGKNIAAIAIDHVGILHKGIDTTKQPTFGTEERPDLGFGNHRTLSEREITRHIKGLAKKFNCFCIVQSQTTKEKAGEGDVRLGLNAAYGAAQFEWDMDYVMTLWQPLRRVEAKTELRVLAWQYCKVREKSSKDKVKTFDPHVLAVDIDSGRLRPMNYEEFGEFLTLEKEATILRRKADKNETAEYRKIEEDQSEPTEKGAVLPFAKKG